MPDWEKWEQMTYLGARLHEALLAQSNTLQFTLFSGLLARRYPVYSKINY